MENKVLNGRHRTGHGKAFVGRLRRSGRIPGVMYDRHGKSMSVDFDYNEFVRLYKSVTESTIVQVKLDEDSADYHVFIKDYQYNIVDHTIEHVDLYEVEAGKELRTLVGIKLEGAPKGVRDGGVLEAGLTEIEVECLPKDLPPRIIVDVSDLGANESIHVRDLDVSDAVKILSDADQVVATVKFITDEIPSTEESEEPELVTETTTTESSEENEESAE